MVDNNFLISDSTLICTLTVGQFKELLTKQEASNIEPQPPKRYIYGLKGIRELLHCSHATAQKLKDTILKPAVMQSNRKIVVDEAMALELMKGRGRACYGR